MKHMLRGVACMLLAAALLCGLTACGNGGKTPEEPTKTQATVGESLSTLFFNFTVDKAQRVDNYEAYTPQEGQALVLVQITVTNTQAEAVTMYDSDFTLTWGDGADQSAWVFDAFADAMQPAEDVVNAGESRSYDLLFAVPEAQKAFALQYTETYRDEAQETQQGNTFRVEFEA